MPTYIALFRGINVGGNNSLPMKVLVELLENLDCQNVRTYIQSGNAVLASKERSAARLSGMISAAIKKHRGFEPHVLLIGLTDLERTIEQNPFPEAAAAHKSLHVGFLATAPRKPDLAALETIRAKGERFQLIGKAFYLHAPAGVGNSKLAARAEKSLGVPMTMRNWRTVCQIRDIADAK